MPYLWHLSNASLKLQQSRLHAACFPTTSGLQEGIHSLAKIKASPGIQSLCTYTVIAVLCLQLGKEKGFYMANCSVLIGDSYSHLGVCVARCCLLPLKMQQSYIGLPLLSHFFPFPVRILLQNQRDRKYCWYLFDQGIAATQLQPLYLAFSTLLL